MTNVPKRLTNVPAKRTHDARGRAPRFCANDRCPLPDAGWLLTTGFIVHWARSRGAGLQSCLSRGPSRSKDLRYASWSPDLADLGLSLPTRPVLSVELHEFPGFLDGSVLRRQPEPGGAADDFLRLDERTVGNGEFPARESDA